MNRLVRNLLDMTSLEAGVLRVRNKQWQPLEEVIGVALNRLEEQLEDRSVHVDIPSEASLVPFDATLVEQLFINLVENAIKYTRPRVPSPSTLGGRSRSGGHRRGLRAWRACGRRGVDLREFHRAARSGPGMGIGLTICRGIVVAHGGKIWYEPGRPGRGLVSLHPAARRCGAARERSAGGGGDP